MNFENLSKREIKANLGNKNRNANLEGKRSFFKQFSKKLLFSLAIVLSGYLVYADYVGTLTNRIFLDPASVPAISDGYQNNDILSYIAESTPNAGTGSLEGAGAWNTLYIPPGVAVIGVAIVQSNGDGTYSDIPAPAVAPIKNGCGNRGCKFPTSGNIQNGKLNEGQQDAGIFYSTNSRTQLLSAALAADPTGSGTQEVWNLWDAQQIRAYGGKAQLTAGGPINGAISPNGGQGNTGLVDTTLSGGGGGAVWAGTGSPVAGPQTYFKNDYNPVCSLANNNVYEAGDLTCPGPWQRIAYMGSTIGGSGPVTPTIIDGDPPNLNTSVPTSLGWGISESNPLPSNVNAVRYVIGKRVVGELETVRITFKITNVAAFTASLSTPTSPSFCYDATGGDNNKDGVSGRGAQDNIWRYYEGNNHFCYQGSVDANALKTTKTADGVAFSGSANANSIIGYELNFTNTSSVTTLTNIVFQDTPTTPGDLALISAGNALCPYPNYNGNFSGTGTTPTLNSLTPTLATWNAIPTLPAGQSVSVFLCAQVDNGAKSGTPIKNKMSVTYQTPDLNTHVLESENLFVISTIISGNVFLEQNTPYGTDTPDDVGLPNVIVELYSDLNGNGILDALEPLLDSHSTNAAGNYSFVGQPGGGDYLVVETGLTSLMSTWDSDTAYPTCIPGSIASTSCNVISILNLTGSSLENNFYNVAASIGDFIWNDLNGDGIQDGGAETGIDGVTVELYQDNNTNGVIDTGDTLLDTQTTAGGGAYDFIGLDIGAYIVDVVSSPVLAEYAITTTNDPLPVVITAAGQDFNDADFGYQQQADVTITKDDSLTEYTPGSPVTYVITVSNIGPSSADGTVIADTFPSQITTVSWTCAATGSAVCPNASGTSSPLSETIATFPNGGQLVYTITAQTDPAATTDLINSATATLPTGTTDPTSVANVNTATDPTDTPNFVSDLYITKSDTPTTYTPGDTTTYTIVVGNLGPSNVVGATVSDTLPNGLSLSAPITCVATPIGTATCNSPIGAVNDTSFTDTVGIAADPSGIDGTGDSYVTYTVPVKYSSVMADYL